MARLLDAADESDRERGVALAADLARDGRLSADAELLERLARLDEATPWSAAALAGVAELVRSWSGEAAEDPVAALFLGEGPRCLRRLAARVLDASGQRPELALALAPLGDEAAAFLGPYLEHSGATHQDLLEVAAAGHRSPALVDDLRRAERTLGPTLLREVIGRLGWPRLTGGLAAETCLGLSVGGSFPFVLAPAQAQLLAGLPGTETLWRRHLVIAHGGAPAEGGPATTDATVERFRAYNLTHAALLDEILAVAPLDEAKVQRILGLMDRAVSDFAVLFAGISDDAGQVEGVYQRLRELVAADLGQDRPRGALSSQTVRRMQMFEDPQRLEDVTTVHGLKRYLHQQGLRLAFRLFRSHQGADRTVDLLVVGERELACQKVIRYLEFEPTPPVGGAHLPFLVSLVAEALGRQLLHGRKPPWVTVLGYGNEFQIYVNYRNHPAFIRIDLSPPLRGGMIDLEYFAVSQYELDQHPDLSLQGIQRVLRQLDLDVSKDGLRLKARYDKERARDLGDLVAKARELFDLLPSLMDVDWVIGDLDYPVSARVEVAAAWAGFFAQWGVVPSAEVLSESRRKILVAVEPDPAGPREVTWDGHGDYRDRFSGRPDDGLAAALRSELERRGLGALATGAPAPGALGQRFLEQFLLRPLAEAAGRGEVREGPAGIEPVPEELFQREHEAARLAALLDEGGPALAAAVRMAALVRGIERLARFRTTGSVQGYLVQAASLPAAPRPVGLFVLRDAHGIVRLALAAAGGVLYRARGAPHEPWRRPDELEVAELARALRAFNYLGAGEHPAPPSEAELEELREAFRAPSPTPISRQAPGERLVPAVVAAPGRATGFALFHTAGRQPADLDGAVLVSRAVRPEDTPWLRHAAGMVSTGGGVLSHVGLVALELQKPALIVDARWATAPSGAEVLRYRRPQWREEASARAGYQVVCRHELHDAEETLEQGDLVTVDGESRSLVVLGHDGQVLALHQDLSQLEAASTALTALRSDDELLACRGRLLRAVHQLERLLSRLERPVLVRHAVRELLTLSRASLAPEGRQGRARLLAALLRNPACQEEAREAMVALLQELRARFEAVRGAAQEDAPHLLHPVEVLFSRQAVHRIKEMLADALDLARARGIDCGPPGDAAGAEAAFLRRTEELRASLGARADACAGKAAERWRLRHLLPPLAHLERVLGAGDAPAAGVRRGSPGHAELAAELRREDELRLRELAGRRILGLADGGVELRPLVGGKGAHLGEIARILGPAAAPPWFAVTDAAFREVLATPVPAAALETLRLERVPHLAGAIAQVMGHADWDGRRQANLVRELWQAVPLPAELAREVVAAYRALSPRPGEDAQVAVRSSSRDEDGESAAWAGQFDTFLFVTGTDALLEHLKLAWAGFWTERAIDQRRLPGAALAPPGGGVVVQRMVVSRVSGVLHTVAAASGQLRQMVVNAGLGLGEGIVSGTVDVDHILVFKNADLEAGELQLRYRVGDKREQVVWDAERGSGTRRQETRYHQRLRPALEYVELCELVRDAARLETAFAQPLDIEFAIEGRDLHILQARPVPTFVAAWRESFPRAEGPPPGQEAA